MALVGTRRALLGGRSRVIASEDFSVADGTAITAIAFPWTKHASGAANNIAHPSVDNGTVHGEDATTTSVYYRADIAALADALVEVDLVMRSDNDLSTSGVVARLSTAAATYYQARYATSGNVLQLFKTVAGVSTQLGGNVAQALTVDEPHRLGLSVYGNTVVLLYDRIERIVVTDSAIPAAGRVGIRFNSNATATTGLHLDNWMVFA